jgi:hypothetical protein
MRRERASCLVGTPGLPRWAREVGHPAPLLTAWSAVGPASAARSLSLHLTAEGDPVRAVPLPCGWSMSWRHDDPADRGRPLFLRFVGGALALAVRGGGVHASLVMAYG